MTDSTSSVRPAVIEVTDLVTHYGTRQILNGVSLDIADGEIMVVMGGSGSGKSTFLRHLLGLEQATSGTVRILGKDHEGVPRRWFPRFQGLDPRA